jgi:hypothetical protein
VDGGRSAPPRLYYNALRFDYRDESRVTSHLFPAIVVMVSRDTRDTETEAAEEQIHFQNVITTIQQYAPYTVCPCALTHTVVLNFGKC